MNTSQHDTTDNHKSSDTLEREVDQVRARLNTRAHELSDRLSPGELLDQSLHMVRDHAGEFGHNLGAQVKQNPLPTILTGIGMAWMMLSSSKEITHYYEPATDYPSMDYDEADGHPDMMGRAGESLGKAGDSIRHSAERAGESFRNSTEKARHLRESVSGRMHHASGSLRHQAENTRYRFQNFLQEQPIVAGGLGLALGAFIGALIPPTATEDRALGHVSDEAAVRAREAASRQYDKAKEQVREVAEEAKSRQSGGDGADGATRPYASRAGNSASGDAARMSSAPSAGSPGISEPGRTGY